MPWDEGALTGVMPRQEPYRGNKSVSAVLMPRQEFCRESSDASAGISDLEGNMFS